MSYEIVLAGLHERFATVAGLKAILDYEPKTIDSPPVLYSMLDSFQRQQDGQQTAMRYRILHRVLIAWQDNEQAERELIPFVNSIAAAVDADPTLGGRVARGVARVTDGQSVFITINKTLFRALDIYSDVLEKAAVRSGI